MCTLFSTAIIRRKQDTETHAFLGYNTNELHRPQSWSCQAMAEKNTVNGRRAAKNQYNAQQNKQNGWYDEHVRKQSTSQTRLDECVVRSTLSRWTLQSVVALDVYQTS